MKPAIVVILILFVLVIAAGLDLYLKANDKYAFFLSLYGNVLATVIFGTIIAYALYLVQIQNQGLADSAAFSNSRGRLIALLRNELANDLNAVRFRITDSKDVDTGFQSMYENPVDDDFWRSVSNSGDLKYMNDLDLLAKVSTAYRRINKLNYWQNRFYENLTGSGRGLTMTMPDGKAISLLSQAYSFYTPTLQPCVDAISGAIDALDAARQ